MASAAASSAATPLQWSDHDSRNRPRRAVSVDLLDLGSSGTITDADLVLNGLSHYTPDDIDILLVGPQGQDAIVMSDAGGGYAVNEIDLTLDDQAAEPLRTTRDGPGSF